MNEYLQTWYVMVQDANLYIQTQAPWVKLKNQDTRDDGILDLQYLL
jgi:methionyl-tRNA synthetase